MNHPTYPNLKQSSLLLIFLFTFTILYLFLTLTLPQLVGFQLPLLYVSIVSALAPIACLLPLIIIISKKSGVQVKWPIKLPKIHIIFLLVILSVAIIVITRPFINSKEYLRCLINGELKLVVYNFMKFDWNILIKLIGAVLITPIFEEIVFRKQILGLLLKKYTPFVAIVLSSILFTAGHFRFNEIGILLVWGLLFGIVYFLTNSIETSILLHSIGNFFNFFIKHEFVEITGLLLFKYILLMAGSLLIILLIIKYLKRYGMAKTINSTEITDASLPAGG
jgi:uncharacterized protein